MTDQITVEAPAEEDPVFAAIELHRSALVAFEEIPEAMEKENASVYEAAADLQSESFGTLLATAPATKAGAHAVLEYLISLEWDECLPLFAETIRASQIFCGLGNIGKRR